MTRSEMMGMGKLATALSLCAFALLCVMLKAPNAHAYPEYDDGSGNGCVQCHITFQGGSGTLHSRHRLGLNITSCNLCHPSGGGSTPVLTYSSGTGGGYGCSGCHGQDYGETSIITGQPKASGYGLRQAHANAGVTVCQNCHTPSVTILPETALPPYYGQPTSSLKNPCSGVQEDTDSDGLGLDNDGNGLRDFPADPACAAQGTTTTTLPTPAVSCGPAPVLGCVAPAKMVLMVNEKSAGKEKVKVSLTKLIPAVSKTQFGDPVTGTTSYAVCIYDASNQLVGEFDVAKAAQMCGAELCWEDKSTTGYQYTDKAASADAVRKMQLFGGDAGKGKVVVKGKSNGSSFPTGIAPSLFGNTSATVQMISSDGGSCFSATVTTVKKADFTVFSGVAP